MADGDRDVLTWMLLLVGIFPIAGLAIVGRWPGWEVGAGMALALFAIRQLHSGS